MNVVRPSSARVHRWTWESTNQFRSCSGLVPLLKIQLFKSIELSNPQPPAPSFETDRTKNPQALPAPSASGGSRMHPKEFAHQGSVHLSYLSCLWLGQHPLLNLEECHLLNWVCLKIGYPQNPMEYDHSSTFELRNSKANQIPHFQTQPYFKPRLWIMKQITPAFCFGLRWQWRQCMALFKNGTGVPLKTMKDIW